MHKDDRLMFESYIKKIEETKASPSNFSGLPVKPVGNFANSPVPKGYDAMQNMINMKLAAKDKKKSEDEEVGCVYAREQHCSCDGCEDCKKNQMSENNEGTKDDIMDRIEQKRKERKNIGSVRSEDAETHGVEGKIKAALQEIESFGYTGDHIHPMDVAKLVVGSPGDWGDSYVPLVQALAVVISNYYEKGLQDS
jgi:hypothetical protein